MAENATLIWDDWIYTGSLPAARNEKWLSAAGITHVLSLTDETVWKSMPQSVQYHLQIPTDDYGIVHNATPRGLQYTSLTECLDRCFMFTDNLRFANPATRGKLLIHCRHGINGSVAFTAALLMMMNDVTFEDALAHIKARRPCAAPNDERRSQVLRYFAALDDHTADTAQETALAERSPISESRGTKPSRLSRSLWRAICSFLSPLDIHFIADRDIPMLSPICRASRPLPLIDTCINAAIRERNPVTLLWALSAGFRPRQDSCALAAASDHAVALPMLKILETYGAPMDSAVCYEAALKGNLELIKWAYTNGCQLSTATCTIAASGGHLDLLKWAREHNCPWGVDTCVTAARGRQWDVLKWLHAEGCPRDERTCAEIARTGHLDILQWAKMYGFPWDETTCAAAAGEGLLLTLQYARAARCPWDSSTTTNAIRAGHEQVLAWALAQGCPYDPSASKYAMRDGHYHILRWLIAHNYTKITDVYEYAKSTGNQDLQQWMRSHDPGTKEQTTAKKKQ